MSLFRYCFFAICVVKVSLKGCELLREIRGPQFPAESIFNKHLAAVPRFYVNTCLNIPRYVTSLITRVFVTVKLADVGGRNAGYFGARKFSKMFTTQAIFGVWCMVGAVCSGAMKFLEKRVALSVREILYEELTDRSVYHPSPYYFFCPLLL